VAKIELGSFGINSPKFIEWLINDCREDKDNREDILTKEAIEFFAERLTTLSQIAYYLTRALEKGNQIGEKPVSI
jgi:hypothetical protein